MNLGSVRLVYETFLVVSYVENMMKVMFLSKRTVYRFILAILILKCQAFKYPHKAKFTV